MSKFIIDNSALAAKRVCTMQWALRYGLGLKKKGENAAPMAGKAGHAALAVFRRGGDIPASLKAFDSMYQEWAEQNPPEERLSWQNVNDILATYLAQHQLKKSPFIPLVQYVEAGLTVQLTPEINLFALIDCPAVDAATGALVVVDSKFTGKISAWWMKKWRLSSQMIGYMWAMETAYQKPCDRAYIDAIELGKLPDDNGTKCRTHKMPQSECRFLHAHWELLVVSANALKKENWKREAIQTAKECMALLPAVRAVGIGNLRVWPQEGMWNNGCTFCEFADLCAGDCAPQLVETLLVYDPWEPWAGKGEAGEE